jgi:hypothetical protein
VRRQRERGAVERISPLWLAHHYPEDYDRCVRIRRTHVCRRCLVLYPLASVVLVLSFGASPPAWVDVVALVVLPLPALVELVGEQLGRWRYRPTRQMAVTVPLAVGLGRGFARYLDDQADPLFWGVVVGYTTIALAALWWRWRHPGGRTRDASV